jgi:virulence factor Mce-like protein
MRPRRGTSIAANPVLVGAVTTLVVTVAVFLAYNANNGLPFVPTDQYKVELSNGSNLVKGNEVREGGFRIGVIEDVVPITLGNGQTVARLSLKLDRKTGKLPVDTRIKIRPRSALGLKYAELTRGTSRATLKGGDTIPLAQTEVPVQFDDVYKTFDAPTREASKRNLEIFGNGFAGRGAGLNDTIAALPPLLAHLEPVARLLAQPSTGLRRFFRSLARTTAAIAPVAEVNAQLFADMATTFEAISRDRNALEQTIAKSPLSLEVGTDSLRAQRPFLRHTVAFSLALRSATRELRPTLPPLNLALEAGTPVLRRTAEINPKLKDALGALQELASAPLTNQALRALVATTATLNPTLRYLGPFVTVCNGWNYFWTFLGEHISEPDKTGTSQRAMIGSTAPQDNDPGSIGAAGPATGTGYVSALSGRGAPVVLHGQPYAAAINNDGTADCETGQRGYVKGPLLTLGDAKKFPIVVDPHTPGSQGPTFKGRPSVLPGQTFTRDPQRVGKLNPALTTGIYSGNVK